MKKAKTHFEQIPVAVVERLVEREEIEIIEDGRKKKIAPANVIVEKPVFKSEPHIVRTTF